MGRDRELGHILQLKGSHGRVLGKGVYSSDLNDRAHSDSLWRMGRVIGEQGLHGDRVAVVRRVM